MHEPLELADEGCVPSFLEVVVDPALEAGEPELVEPCDLRLRKAMAGELRQRLPAP